MAVFLSLQMGSPFIHPQLILDVMTRKEILDWIRIYKDQPFGEEREDERAELISWFALSSFGGGKGLDRLLTQFRREDGDTDSEAELHRARAVAQAKNRSRRKQKEEKERKQQAAIEQQTRDLRPT